MRTKKVDLLIANIEHLLVNNAGGVDISALYSLDSLLDREREAILHWAENYKESWNIWDLVRDMIEVAESIKELKEDLELGQYKPIAEWPDPIRLREEAKSNIPADSMPPLAGIVAQVEKGPINPVIYPE